MTLTDVQHYLCMACGSCSCGEGRHQKPPQTILAAPEPGARPDVEKVKRLIADWKVRGHTVVIFTIPEADALITYLHSVEANLAALATPPAPDGTCEQHKHVFPDVGCWVCRAQLAEMQLENLKAAPDAAPPRWGGSGLRVIEQAHQEKDAAQIEAVARGIVIRCLGGSNSESAQALIREIAAALTAARPTGNDNPVFIEAVATLRRRRRNMTGIEIDAALDDILNTFHKVLDGHHNLPHHNHDALSGRCSRCCDCSERK